MNLWLILLFTLPVIGLFLFGGNPLREWQQEQRKIAKTYGNDELTVMTNYYAEQQQKATGTLQAPVSIAGLKKTMTISGVATSAGNVNAFGVPTSVSGLGGGYAGLSGAAVAQPDDQFPDDVAGYVEVIQKPGSSSQQAMLNSQMLSVPQSTKPVDSYYPPIVGEAEPLPQKNILPPMVLTGKEHRLRSGQIIAFDGVKVFYVDRAGRRFPMPDGDYFMQNGREIRVSGGRNKSK